MTSPHTIAVMGAASLVGDSLMDALGERALGISRTPRRASGWATYDTLQTDASHIETWICVVPVWVLPTYFPLLEHTAIRRLVALSSTSALTKQESSEPYEQRISQQLREGETALHQWCTARGIECVILRTTLIYGRGRDKNVTEIARMIERFGFFPLLGRANGLRQPVHADDVASACIACATTPALGSFTAIFTGAETLDYRMMVSRIFDALHRTPRFLPLPAGLFGLAIRVLRRLPRFSHWNTAMVQRMNQDLVFESDPRLAALSITRRDFHPSARDLGLSRQPNTTMV